MQCWTDTDFAKEKNCVNFCAAVPGIAGTELALDILYVRAIRAILFVHEDEKLTSFYFFCSFSRCLVVSKRNG